MQTDFLYYYNNELLSIRTLAQEFANTHPKVAGNLLMAGNTIEDPHVNLLIESLAFLTAQIQYKLDQDLPELAEGLLEILYPHYQAPFPSCTIAILQCQPELTEGYELPKDSLVETKPSFGTKCRFKTVYPIKLWPIAIKKSVVSVLPFTAPKLRSEQTILSIIQISLECQNEKMTFAKLAPDHIRFYINLPSPYSGILYEMIFNGTVAIALAKSATDENPIILSKKHIVQVGFSDNENLMPYNTHSSLGYRLLTEYFSFPEKFLFFDIKGLDASHYQHFDNTMEIFLYLDQDGSKLQKLVDKNSFKLGCVPLVNIFEQIAEPIRYTHTAIEHQVIPDAHRKSSMEIYAIKKVTGITERGNEIEFFPFYGVHHHYSSQKMKKRFWQAKRRANFTHDDNNASCEVYLSLTDSQFNIESADNFQLQVETLCTDGSLPAQLFSADNESYFQLDTAAPIHSIKCLIPFTKPRSASLKNDARWKLISHLSLNYLSLENEEINVNALKEILSLYDFTKSAESNNVINGIVSLKVRRITSRSPEGFHSPLCQGIEINLTVDHDRYASSNLYLFSSVLEVFFSEYASINSFTKLNIYSKQSNGKIFEWQSRSGSKYLL